jgi:hypothetical protein
MTSLAHFEKVARVIDTPHLAVSRDRSLHVLYKYADLKSESITIH